VCIRVWRIEDLPRSRSDIGIVGQKEERQGSIKRGTKEKGGGALVFCKKLSLPEKRGIIDTRGPEGRTRKERRKEEAKFESSDR